MRSHPPTQETSLVYAFDPDKREVVAQLTPWPDADVTDVLGVLPGGILVISVSGEIALVDTETRQVLFQGKPPFNIPRKIEMGADGNAYCLTGGSLCRWDTPTNTLTPVAQGGGCSFFTEPSPGLWILADSTSVYRVRVKASSP